MWIVQKIMKYFRWSNLKLSIDFSPFTWSFKWISDRENPDIKYMLYVRALAFSFLLIVDNGAFNEDGNVNDVD